MVNLVNPYIAVLDACVLVPMPIADILLRLAEEPAFYMPRWSEDILREVRSTLLKFDKTEAQADRRIKALKTAFPEALVTGYESLVGSMPNDEKHRHVLAAAVVARAM